MLHFLMPARLRRLYNQLSSGTTATRHGPGLGPQRQATGPFACSKGRGHGPRKGLTRALPWSRGQYWQRRAGSRRKERSTSASPTRSLLQGVRGEPVSDRGCARTAATRHSTVHLSPKTVDTVQAQDTWTSCGARRPSTPPHQPRRECRAAGDPSV